MSARALRWIVGVLAIGCGCSHPKTVFEPPAAHSNRGDEKLAAPTPISPKAAATQTTSRTARTGTDKLATFSGDEELIAFLRSKNLIYDAPDPKTNAESVWGKDIPSTSSLSEGLGLSGAGVIGHGAGMSAQGNMWGSNGAAAAGAGASSSGSSITNNQHAGVDEGDIVKKLGENLIVLRRGRIFTIRLSDLTVVSKSDAFGPGIDPKNAWYDEMLVHDGKVVVIGYSYQREGTEVGVFDITPAGKISHRATYQLRSNDYFGSRNYASRLIGNKLVFYAPLEVLGTEKAPLAWLPSMRRWRVGASKPASFASITSSTKIYKPLVTTTIPSALTLHTVTSCDLSKPDISCTAQGVLGPPGRTFYVSPTAVYVWMSPTDLDSPFDPKTGARITPDSIVERMPLDGSAPTVMGTLGGPIDQFSFLEQDGFLNVMLRADVAGDGMTLPEATFGEVALLRTPLTSFGATLIDAPLSHYRRLTTPTGETMQNRFVGDWLVYGTGTSWARPRSPDDGRVFAMKYAGATAKGAPAPTAITLGHGVDRIEPMGGDAVVVGADAKDLHFSPIALSATTPPKMGVRFTRRGASQGELRSHGFFYRPLGEQKGLLGLPVRGAGEPGHAHLVFDSAMVQFVRNDGLILHDAGELNAHAAQKEPNDSCRASCVDWYGNARPIFVGDRILALLGYEIVEGKIDPKTLAVTETRRSTFTPL